MKLKTELLNLKVNVVAILMALSFLLIHDYDGKWSLPILEWALVGLTAAPLSQRIVCFLILASWIRLWFIAFNANAQNGRGAFMWPGVCLWLTLLWFAYKQFNKPLNYQTLWFWLPTTFFIGFSLILVHWLYFPKKLLKEL